MRRFNLYETSADLKIKLRISQFFGEASFSRNANIHPGTCIPVLLLDNANKMYLHTMKWGIDIFETGRVRNLTNTARSETIFENAAWSPLIKQNQRCIIICKGFYLFHNTEILDPIRRVKKMDRQPYYITPNKIIEGEFFMIAGLYKETRTFNGRKFSCVAMSQQAPNDSKYVGYVQRIPLFLKSNQNSIIGYLKGSNDVFNQRYKIQTNNFLKIGLWINNNDHKDENIVLQSRFDWDLDKEAKMIGFGLEDKNFDFDLIEKEALRQNKCKKMGLTYNRNNWDNLNSETILLNDEILNENNECESEDKELKEEEYNYNNNTNNSINNPKKRQRSYDFNDSDNNEQENDDEEDDEEDEENEINNIINEPPNKRQRLLNMLQNKKPIRRHSEENCLNEMKKRNDKNKRLSANSQ